MVERFGASDAPELQVQVAKALVNKGVTHGQRGESEEELAACAAVVERFGASDAPELQVLVARALVNKGIMHGQRGESEEELAACAAVVERFGASDAPELQVLVARALVNKGIMHGQRGESEEELTACAAVVERFGASDAPDIDDALVALAHLQSDHRQVLRRVVNEQLTVWANELARRASGPSRTIRPGRAGTFKMYQDRLPVGRSWCARCGAHQADKLALDNTPVCARCWLPTDEQAANSPPTSSEGINLRLPTAAHLRRRRCPSN